MQNEGTSAVLQGPAGTEGGAGCETRIVKMKYMNLIQGRGVCRIGWRGGT